MREIVYDSETTGLDPVTDRIVEIAAIELMNGSPTGATFHALINPERSIHADAVAIHGHTADSLKGMPVFARVVEKLLAFIGSSPLVIHNADFDVGFLNAEFARINTSTGFTSVVDTLALAREKHPGKSNSLDALCDRYHIDRSRRVKHGALVDAELLARVYLELLGERQRSLVLDAPEKIEAETGDYSDRPARCSLLDTVAIEAHAAFVSTLGKDSVWATYLKAERVAA